MENEENKNKGLNFETNPKEEVKNGLKIALAKSDEKEMELQNFSQFTNIEHIIKAEIDTQILTARQFPRSIKKFIDTALSMATLDTETAEACMYAVPRSGELIEGPSIRLAEIVQVSYGNLRSGASIVGRDSKTITARAFAHDLETNVSVSVEIQRRITDKNGRTFSDDMIVVTGNAANAVALRNAIFKIIPMAFTKVIFLKVKEVIKGSTKDIVTRRINAFDYFNKLGVNNERIFSVLNVKGIEDVGLEQLFTLIGIKNAVDNGDTTIEEAFPIVRKEPQEIKDAKEKIKTGLNDKKGDNK